MVCGSIDFASDRKKTCQYFAGLQCRRKPDSESRPYRIFGVAVRPLPVL
jgi:hypothetical protein